MELNENERLLIRTMKFPIEYQKLTAEYAGFEDLFRQLIFLNKKEISKVVNDYFEEQTKEKDKIRQGLEDVDNALKRYRDNATKAIEYLKKLG